MLSAKRHEFILEQLEREKMIKVSEISKLIGVTEKTIRMDLITLEEQGVLRRVHGGAIPLEKSSIFPIAERQEMYIHEKQKIAQKAVEKIVDGDTIFLDGGSTMREIAQLLTNHKITIITNDLQIANIVIKLEQPELIMLGGMPVGATSSLYGPLAKDALANIRVKHLFLGTTGISVSTGLTVFHTLHAEYKREIMKIADHITLCCDHTKFGNTALFKFADLKEVDTLITDHSPEQMFLDYLAEEEIKLIIV